MMSSRHRILFLVISIVGSVAFASNCQRSDYGPIVDFGGDGSNNIVCIFRLGTSLDEINIFSERVIATPSDKGHWPLPGILMTGSIRKGKFKGYILDFRDSATKEQKAFIKNRIRNSPIVYRIYENKLPEQIHDLGPNGEDPPVPKRDPAAPKKETRKIEITK